MKVEIIKEAEDQLDDLFGYGPKELTFVPRIGETVDVLIGKCKVIDIVHDFNNGIVKVFIERI